MSCMCLVFKTKLFWSCIAIVMKREKDEVLGINVMQINYQYVFKPLHYLRIITKPYDPLSTL